MQIDPSTSPHSYVNKLMTSLIIPRPIGWISTVDVNGIRNLAPFSAFNYVSHAPPMLMASFSPREGRPKDTLANIMATREFVVSLVTEELGEQMNCTSGNYPPDVDEFQVANLTPVPSVRVAAPRVGESPVNMECVLVQILELPRSTNVVVIGEVVLLEVADRILNERGTADPRKLKPLARVGGSGWYTKLGELFEMKRRP